MTKPIFIISPPRSGSTLLQKIMGAHEQIYTIAEPWIMLPLVYSYKYEPKNKAIYNSWLANIAINDLIDNLPGKESEYRNTVREFVLSLYSSLNADNTTYFLDKTPRYYYIIDELVKIFPDAKYVVLMRNPVDIACSILYKWNKNDIYRLRTNSDINLSIHNICKMLTNNKVSIYYMKYEDLVVNTEREIQNLFSFLNLDYDNTILTNYQKLDLKGFMGDQEGSKYTRLEINTNKINKVINTKQRKNNFIKWIDSFDLESLEILGYGYNSCIKRIDSTDQKLCLQQNIKDYLSLAKKVLRYTKKIF